MGYNTSEIRRCDAVYDLPLYSYVRYLDWSAYMNMYVKRGWMMRIAKNDFVSNGFFFTFSYKIELVEVLIFCWYCTFFLWVNMRSFFWQTYSGTTLRGNIDVWFSDYIELTGWCWTILMMRMWEMDNFFSDQIFSGWYIKSYPKSKKNTIGYRRIWMGTGIGLLYRNKTGTIFLFQKCLNTTNCIQ